MRNGRRLAIGALLVAASGGAARAQEAAPALLGASVTLPPVEVVGTTPLIGSGIDRDKMPADTRGFTDADLRRTGPASVLRTLDERVGSVTLSDGQGNPFQPSLTYRGFQASPLVGNQQGLAVYLNGGRFNQPFGDTVNWDLIPDIAISRMNLVGSNPAYGLNALGGALAVETKNGFTYTGTELELSGGSFGRIQGGLQHGQRSGDVAAYVALRGLGESGWREFSPSDLRQLYGDVGWRGARGEVHADVVGADNSLTGNGTTPVELLAVDRAAVFTHPDQTHNKYARLGLSGLVAIDDANTLQAVAYYSNFDQRTRNADAAIVEACDANAAVICVEDGPPLTDRNRNPIANFITGSPYAAAFPKFRNGGPYAFLNQTGTDTNGYGLSLQLTNVEPLFDLPNHFVVGASYDGGATTFSATTAVGGLSLDRGFVGPGVVVAQADGSITPVRVAATNNYYAVFASDTLDVTQELAVTVAGRFNLADVALNDKLGTSLTGGHSFDRFNPSAGATYKLMPGLSAYAGYAEANRAPTPAELTCANPLQPCSLTNFFVGDPNLKQVVARTVEAGLRGQVERDARTLAWHAGVFRTDSDDDIQFVASPTVGRDFFQNVGTTRRQGFEVGARLRVGWLSSFVDYTYTNATFQSALTVDAGSNPQGDAAGLLHVRPGNHLPGVPDHVVKFGAGAEVVPGWTVGVTGRAASGQYLIGDPSNQNARTASYVVLNLNTEWRVTDHVTVFGLIQNLTDAHYATFGTFSPVGADTPILQVPGASNPRALSPGAPIGGFAGLRVSF
jgi:outer membrane receptor protein involved in Fe transport